MRSPSASPRSAVELATPLPPPHGAKPRAHERRFSSAVRPEERPALVERFETRVYEKGDKLISEGERTTGLHLIASGEVAVVRTEGGEPFVLATLGPGRHRG